MNYKEYYDEFNKNYNYIYENVKQIQEKLDLSVEMISTLKIKKEIVRLDNKFIELFGNTGTKVIQVIDSADEFKDGRNGSLIAGDINIKLDFLKESIKNIKIRYIRKYNAIVENTNKKIASMKKMTGINSESASRIQNLKELPSYVVEKNFAFNNKLKNVKNAKVIDTINEIESINSLISHIFKGDIFTLDDRIDKLEKAINDLNKQLLKKENILNREEREKINLIIDKCDKELELCEEYLKLHQEEYREKCSDLKARINKVQEKLNDTYVRYRKKCPLLVKKVKTAKEIYEKNKKLPLVAIGLSSLSLIDFVVGPIVIPAIMCGNARIAQKYPKINNVNDVLARTIDARKYKNDYILHTGVELNEETASVAILKAIAVSEAREWIVPLVYSAKNLFEKIKLVRLKENITKKVNNASEKIKNNVENVKNTVADNIKVKDTLLEISKLFKEFQQSKLSMNEFCKRNNISVDDRIMLETFNKKVMG